MTDMSIGLGFVYKKHIKVFVYMCIGIGGLQRLWKVFKGKAQSCSVV